MNNPPAQTPITLLNGGGAGFFSDECKKALIQCGYDPSWFGSYDHVKKKIDEADDKVKKFEATGQPPVPTDADRFLAQCQSGHMSQDAIWRKSGGRDSPCDNHPGAAGNVTGLAPAMPHSGESNRVGSVHQQITVDERDQATQGGTVPPGTAMDDKQIENCAAHTNKLATKGITQDAPAGEPKPLLDKAEQLRQDREAAETAKDKDKASALKDQERATRADAHKQMQQRSAAALAKEHNVQRPTSPEDKDAAAKKAAECMEAFRKAGLNAMRQQVVDDHSTENKKKKAEAAAKDTADAKAKKAGHEKDAAKSAEEEEKAKARKDAAQKKLDEHEQGKRKMDAKAKELRAERDAAKADRVAHGKAKRSSETKVTAARDDVERKEKAQAEAERLQKNPTPDEKCLEDQANDLAKMGGNYPPMIGEVPGRRPTDTSGEDVDFDAGSA